MKQKVVFLIFFCLNITQILHSSASGRRDETSATLRNSLRKAKKSNLYQPAVQTTTPEETLSPEPTLTDFMFPSQSGDNVAGTAAPSDDEDAAGLSTTSFQGNKCRFDREKSRSIDGAGLSTTSESDPIGNCRPNRLSVSSIRSIQSASFSSNQPPTPQQQMRLHLEQANRARHRKPIQSVTIVTPSGLSPKSKDDLATSSIPNNSSVFELSMGHPRPRAFTIAQKERSEHDEQFDDQDEIIEMTPPLNASVRVNTQDPNIWKYVLTGSISALSASAATFGIMSLLRPQKRMFTGFELPAAMFVGQTTSKIVAGTTGVIAVTVAFSRFNAWIHTGCHSKQKILEMKFESALRDRMMEHRQETVKQITDVTTQVTRVIEDHREDTREVIGHLVEAVGRAADLLDTLPTAPGQTPIFTINTEAPATSAAAAVLHNAKNKASNDMVAQATQKIQITAPPKPQEKTKCGCCCIQ